MAISIDQIERTGEQQWRYTYSGTTPFRLLSAGQYVEPTRPNVVVAGVSTSALTYTVAGESDLEPPAIEILDSTGGTPESITNSPLLVLLWRGVSEAYYYQVQKLVSGVYVDQTVVAEGNLGYYSYQTPAQTDGTASSWRILVVDTEGNVTTGVDFTKRVIRNPVPPEVQIDWDSATSKIVVSAA